MGASEIIEMWETRGRCPAAVSVTGQLLRTHLRPTSFPESALRLEISMALTRLINGVTDALQKRARASSVGELADKTGLPTILVDVRHTATHRSLPSYHLLLRARKDAEEWLRK